MNEQNYVRNCKMAGYACTHIKFIINFSAIWEMLSLKFDEWNDVYNYATGNNEGFFKKGKFFPFEAE